MSNRAEREPAHCGPVGDAEYEEAIDRIRTPLNAALCGKESVVEMVLACLLARGHLLLEDLPGLGKTTLAKSLARSVGGRFSRVQCTPDLMPSDITGFSVFNQKTGEFDFQEGPVFADVLLADEINRSTPRTQSALFEAMAERQVTIDKHCYTLPESFFVIATQNPLDSHGAYPLPEAQLDRFAVKLSLGYPDRASELAMLASDWARTGGAVVVGGGLQPGELVGLQRRASRVAVAARVREYLVDLAAATRTRRDVHLGVSPRAVLIWQRVAQAHALLQHREFVTPDDVQHVALAVLGVRLVGEFSSPEPVIEQILADTPVPLRL